jgi:hypothetical protein
MSSPRKKSPGKTKRPSKGVIVKEKTADGKNVFKFEDRKRYDDIVCEQPIVKEDDYETAFFEGGSRIKILVASSNVGNAPVLEMDSWVPRNAPHTDIVVFGLQESTYKATVSEVEDEVNEATVALLNEELEKDEEQESTENTAKEISGGGGGGAVEEEEESEDEDDEDDQPVKHTHEENLSGSRHLLLAIQRQLGDDFVLLERVMRGQMRIRVYIRKSLAAQVSNVEIGAENTGIAHIYANKGGQGVKFELAGTSIVFVNSHLAAHESAAKCNKRNSNVREIFGGLRFGNKMFDMTQFDHVIWCGDLNYRIEPPQSMARPEAMKMVKNLIEKDDFGALWGMDELQREIKAGRAYCNFNTAECNFKPTFKVERVVATNYNPKRIPSYCDRVVWKSLKHLQGNLQCHAFNGCHAFATSDHKPIVARFGITPTAKTPTCEWPSYNGHGFDFFPQLKFFELRARDLEAMDEGLTLQQTEAKQKSFMQAKQASFAAQAKQQEEEAAAAGGGGGGDNVEEPKKAEKARGWTIGAAKSDPYCLIHTFPPKLKASPKDLKTETVMQALSPTWDAQPILSLKVANSEPLKNASFKISVIDYDALNADDVIGSAEFTFQELLEGQDEKGIFMFERDVVFKGNVRGIVCGKIEVNIPDFKGNFPHKNRCIDDKSLTVVTKPATCCTIS